VATGEDYDGGLHFTQDGLEFVSLDAMEGMTAVPFQVFMVGDIAWSVDARMHDDHAAYSSLAL
jgi:hypothetical protein